MSGQLQVESQKKPLADLLFLTHQLDDVSSALAHRKEGTDFFLSLRTSAGGLEPPLRGENKFEDQNSGRMCLEVVSVDRSPGGLVPGWLYTSQAAWLLSWFTTGELVAMRMDEIRSILLPRITSFSATTAGNRGYLTWNALVDIAQVLQLLPSARWLDLRIELGQEFRYDPVLAGVAENKLCSVDELVELMRKGPTESLPVAVTQEELQRQVRALAPKDRCRARNATMRDSLPWLRAPSAPAYRAQARATLTPAWA